MTMTRTRIFRATILLALLAVLVTGGYVAGRGAGYATSQRAAAERHEVVEFPRGPAGDALRGGTPYRFMEGCQAWIALSDGTMWRVTDRYREGPLERDRSRENADRWLDIGCAPPAAPREGR